MIEAKPKRQLNKQMKKSAFIFGVLLILSALVSATAQAAGGAAHGDDHIPWKQIGTQAINLGILLAILFHFARKATVQMFVQKRADYVEQSQKTERALKLAENNLKEAREKLKALESGEAHSITTSTAEAESAKNKIVREAEQQAVKLKSVVKLVVEAEVFKAKTEIRQQIIEQSLASVESSIKQSSAAITQKSESGFLQDLGQVKT